MADLNDIYEAIGGLKSDVKSILKNQDDHQRRDDTRHDETQAQVVTLSTHVNHENEKMDKRITALEESHKSGKARAKLLFEIGSVILALSGTLVLALDIFWHDLLGGK